MEDFVGILRVMQVVLGIGLVIFIHELGHFIAARLCKVRVDVFSLGFGPRLVGWVRGGTTYQIAAIPLGGYVRMKGDDGLRRPDDPPRERDDLLSKPVGQRFFIYSAGVIMNVLLGVVLFPILFWNGVPFEPPIIGSVAPGSPAWRAGIQPGSEVLAVDGQDVFEFGRIAQLVATSNEESVDLTLLEPGSATPRTVAVTPQIDSALGFPRIGIGLALDEEHRLAVSAKSPAAAAGLAGGVRLLEVEGGDPRLDPYAQLEQALADSAGEAWRLRVSDEDGERWVELAPERVEGRRILGIYPLINRLDALRPDPLAEALGLRPGDQIRTAQGQPILRAPDLRAALLERPGPLALTVQRGREILTLEAPAADVEELESLIDSLAVVADLEGSESTRVTVTPGGGGWTGGLRDRDRILSIAGQPANDWKDVVELVKRNTSDERPMKITVQREALESGGVPANLELSAVPEPLVTWDFGLRPRPASYVYRTEGVAESVRVGVASSWHFLQDTWHTLASMVRGSVSTENLGGIVTISVVSYDWSEQGLAKLLFFMCMLSINLAFINVLPIPVLDGGHLFFLLIEKLKGSPVSDRVMGYSQMIGLVLILSLMVYVTFNDISRLFPG